MKKFVIAFLILLATNLSCKKENPICACIHPPSIPYLNLVIKNVAGDDLLNSNNTGSFSNGQIQFYYKDANGSVKDVQYQIRVPFFYGNANDKFIYNQLYSTDIITVAKTGPTVFYLKLGENAPYELSLELDQQSVVSKLLIDKKEASKENSTPLSLMNIFYLLK
jgi:hypothetical protein